MAEITYAQAVKDAISQEMRRDPRVILFGEDVAHHGGMFRVTQGMLDEFGPERVLDTPISEAAFIGMGLGAALRGLRPVIELMFFDFSLVAMDQILNQVAKTMAMSGGTVKLPLVIRTQGGGYKGAAAQHSQMLEALFLHIPGLKVVTPSTPGDAQGLMIAAIQDDSPVLFIEHKQLYGVAGESNDQALPLGRAKIVRAGDKVTLVSYSYSVHLCLQAAEQLAADGIEAEVIDLCTLNPLDLKSVTDSLAKTHRAVFVHESHARCGVAADLIAQVQEAAFDELDAPILRVCAADVPVPFAKPLEDQVLPSPEKIIARVHEVLA